MKSLVKFSFFVLFTLFIFSCKNDKPTVENDTTLDIAIRTEPLILNPFLNPTSVSREVHQNIIPSMADFDPVTYELVPILIKSVPEGEAITEGPYKGGTKYTMEFRDDVKWDNGSPITSKDFLFSIKAINHPGTNAAKYRSYLQWVTDVEIDPENEKRFHVYFKDFYMLSQAMISTLQVYPQYAYDPTNAMDEISLAELKSDKAEELIKANQKLQDFAQEFNSVKFGRESIVNCGPYKLKSWIANQRIVLEKKENYWAADTDNPALKAIPDKIIFHIIADETAAVTQLKEGNIDLLRNITSSAFFDLQENETYKDEFEFLTEELMRVYYIGINNSKPELASPKVRRALAKLNDVPKLIELIERGLGNPTAGIFNSKKSYYNTDLKPLTLDIEGARDLLNQEGWTDTNSDGTIDKVFDGQKIEMDLDIYITGSDLSKNVALVLQENAKKVGIKINIITKSFAEATRDNLKTRDYDLMPQALSQTLELDDPYSKWHSDNDDPKKANDSSYNSEKADELIEKIRTTRDASERIELYKELQTVMYEDQPVIFLYNPTEKFVLSKRWEGMTTMKRPGYLANSFKPKS